MGETTSIGWTQKSWNPWQGCRKISPGCKLCYMYRDKLRYGQNPEIVVRSKPPTFNAPLKWNAEVAERNVEGPDGSHRALVFTCSWSDWFIEEADPWRNDAWAIIRQCPWLIFQVLTKRADRIADHLPHDWGNGYPNVWLGISAEDQKYYDLRWRDLAEVPAVVRFVSMEPLLAPIDVLAGHGLLCLDADLDRDERGVCLRGREARADRDSGRRNGLAHQGATAETAREEPPSVGEVCVHQGNAKRTAGRGNSPETGLSPLQGTHPSGSDGQPQGREHAAQSSGQPGAGDLLGTDAACDRRSRAQAKGPAGREEQDGEAEGGGYPRDQASTESRRRAAVDRQGLRRDGPADIKNLPGASLGLPSWCIIGGESGPKSRSFDLGAAYSTIAQLQAAKVPTFVKQLGDAPTWNGAPVAGMGRHGDNWDLWSGHSVANMLRVREFPRVRQS